MAFKDYEELDVTRETAVEEEMQSLKKEYEGEKECHDKVSIRRILACLGIASILTTITMLLYHNIIVVDFVTTMMFSMVYFVIFFIIISEIHIILLKRTNIKEDILLLISIIDILICITAFIIGVMASISNIVKAILLIVTAITFIAFIFLMLVGKILGMERK